MSTSQTLAIASHPGAHLWSDRSGFGSDFADLCLDSYLSHNLFGIGIYGWRKRCLYFIVILLCGLVIINLSLTIWIIKVLDFKRDGMGHLRIGKDGVRVEGEASFSGTIYAAEIRTRQNQALNIESSRNITLNTRNAKGRVTNRIHLGEGKMEVFTDNFVIRGPRGELLLHVADEEVVMAAQRMKVAGEGGVTFDGSVQTAKVVADAAQELKLESPTRQVRIHAPEGVAIESKASDIVATCMEDFRLTSREGAIILDSERLEFQNLKTVIPTKRGRSYPMIYEMCSCENGRLFLSPPEGKCTSTAGICK